MAKVSFTKLNLKKNENTKTIEICGQDIEVKQYLPIQEKLQLISDVINLSTTENNFENPVQVDVYTSIKMLDAYTNISFTEKQMEDIAKLYDLLDGNKVFADVFAWIPKSEYDVVVNGIKDTAKAFYKYRNSFVGSIGGILEDYKQTEIDLGNIQETLSNPEFASFIKDLLPLIGQSN